MGPLATQGQLLRIEAEVAAAQEQGGRLLTGGGRPADQNQGYFYEPTIVDCPDQSLRIVDTELFGPVLSVLRFKAEEDALRLANDTRHGLAAGVFTRNGARAMRMSRGLRAGIVWVNTYRVVSPIAPFGGFGESGYGRESGLQGLYDYTRPKTVWINTSDAPLANPFIMR
jgi:acyl-CoA reductase-like NAD-dependent aldehyde dehydrogenase